MTNDAMVDPTEDLILIASDATNGYGRRPIPHPLDDVVHRLVDGADAADSDDRRLFLGLLNLDQAQVFNAYSERMASLAVRRRDPALVRDGLRASALASHVEDIREIILILSLHYRSLEKLGVDPVVPFAEVVASGLGNDGFAMAAGTYPGRREEDRSIGAMGYVEGQDADGFRYVRTW